MSKSPSRPAIGPLRAHLGNGRYFSPDGQRAILLTGSHTWDNLQDFSPTCPVAASMDFEAHLDFLAGLGHNFIRMWRWEMIRWPDWLADRSRPWFCSAPHPWQRTGPGEAADGLAKFDLTRFDEAYFDRLRTRVRQAGERGIYVSIMLFEGYCIRQRPTFFDGHPMHAGNNINGIKGNRDGDGIGLEVQTLKHPAINAINEAYVRKVIETVNDLDNVLYEVSNESEYSPEIEAWQKHIVDFVHQCESAMPKQHPAGITTLIGPGTVRERLNQDLLSGPADWVSPTGTIWNENDPYSSDPPATGGEKVVILDSDHTWNNACGWWGEASRADHAWIWKAFCRGYNPIYMDPMDASQPDAVMASYGEAYRQAIRKARPAMGCVRALSERVDLARLTPASELAESGYCLAEVGREYVVFQPGGGDVAIDLGDGAGRYEVQWVHPIEGTVVAGEPVNGGGWVRFSAPFAGDAAVHLRRLEE